MASDFMTPIAGVSLEKYAELVVRMRGVMRDHARCKGGRRGFQATRRRVRCLPRILISIAQRSRSTRVRR